MLLSRNWDSHLRKGGFLNLTVSASLPSNSNPPLQWLHVKGSILRKRSMSKCPHFYAEAFEANAFALQPRQTHKCVWAVKRHSRQPFAMRSGESLHASELRTYSINHFLELYIQGRSAIF